MSAHRRGLTLRATLIALALGAGLYVAAISGVIAYEIAPRATAIRQQSTKLHAEFEASIERAVALKSAIVEARGLMTRPIAPEEIPSLKAKILSHVDGAGAAQSIGVLSGIPAEMRISLGHAADAESQLGAALIEALAEVELNRYPEAETKLARCDSLQTIVAGHLNEAQRFGLIDLIQRQKSLGEAADNAIKLVGWWAAIGVALLPAFALFIQHRFYRPLAELDRGLASVAGGNIEATVEIRREDELGRLSRHFNRMTDVLRQRAEEERRRAHSVTERFGRILDESSNEIYIFDAETYHFLQVNRGARENLGYTGEEFSALTPLDLMPEFDRASFDELAALMRAGQREMAMISTIHRRKDGSTYPVEVSIQISRSETPTVMVSIVRDITEHRQMQEALRESEERFRLAIDAAQMGTWDWNLVTNHIRRTGRAYQLFGVTQELLGDTSVTFLDRIHPLDREQVREAIRRAISDGALYSEEFRVMLPDGSVRWRAAQGTTFRDQEGRAARMVGVVLDITERKQAEEALRASEQRFARAFNASPNPISIATLREGRLIDVNDAFLGEFGGSREELIGRTAKELGIWVSSEAHAETVRMLYERGSVRDVEAEFRMKDGSKRICSCSGEVIKLDGQPCALFQSSDITERKKMEEALRDSEEMFRTLTETITMAIYIYRANRYLYVNSAAEKISGYTRDEFMRMDSLALVYDEDRDRIIDYMQKRQRGEAAPTRYETRFLDKTSAVRWLDVTVAQIDYKGEPAYLVTAIDITERKQAEANLRESEERFSKAFQASPLAMSISATTDGCIIAANESFLRLHDFSRQDVLGHTAEDIQLWIDPEERERFIRRVIERGEVRDLEAAVRRRNGEELVMLLSGVLIELGGEPCVLFTGSDITERKRAEEEIRRLNEELEHRVTERTAQLQTVNRELEAFSYSVSHDLRAPLRSINGFSLALMEDCADHLDETGKDYLARVRAASQRMGRLIDDLLNLSRITRSDMYREKVDLSALARSVVLEIQSADQARDVEFRIAPEMMAEADPRLLHIALENLLGNSWKFTEKTPRASIEFGCVRDRGETAFFVRDNGAGFDMAYSDKLFGAFQRLHAMTEFKGTGIGLATVQRIINRHGGRIWAESRVGEGATFYFTLP